MGFEYVMLLEEYQIKKYLYNRQGEEKMKKNIALFVIPVLTLAMFSGCAPKVEAPTTTPEMTTEAAAPADAKQLYIDFNIIKGYPKLADAPADSKEAFFTLLPKADWTKIWLLGTDTPKAAFEIMDWLYSHTDYNDAELLDLMNTSTSNIDGAAAEKYASIMSKLFAADMPRFLTLMNVLDGYTQGKVASFAAEVQYDQKDKPWKSLTGLDAGQKQMLQLIEAKMFELGGVE